LGKRKPRGGWKYFLLEKVSIANNNIEMAGPLKRKKQRRKEGDTLAALSKRKK